MTETDRDSIMRALGNLEGGQAALQRQQFELSSRMDRADMERESYHKTLQANLEAESLRVSSKLEAIHSDISAAKGALVFSKWLLGAGAAVTAAGAAALSYAWPKGGH